MGESLLDKLAERIRRWSDSLWEPTGPGRGGFRMNDRAGVNLLSSTDVAWIRYAIGEDDIGGPRRAGWAEFLRSRQDPRTGRFQYEPRAETNLSSGHAMWHTVRALNILGSDLAHFPEYLRPAASPEGLGRFFDAVDWAGPRSNHHEVLGLLPVYVNLGTPEWVELFYRKLAEQQDPSGGTWPRGGPVNISRTFAYTALHLAAGRLPARPEGIIDAMIALQRDDGFWDARPGFLTMDAVFLLTRLPGATGHRAADAAAALRRARAALEDVAEHRLDPILANTHDTLAVVQTFGILHEAFPDAYPCRPPWRFHWDQVRFWRSATIASQRPASPAEHRG